MQRTRLDISCVDCGAQQRVPDMASGNEARCVRCDRLLERRRKGTLIWGQVGASAMLMLLIPANALPVLSASLGNQEQTAHLYSAVLVLLDDGWPVMAAIFAAIVIVLPLIRASLLTLVLTMLHAGHRPRWLGRAFGQAERLELWAMPEVMVLAGFVTYMRVVADVDANILLGGWCFIGAAILSLLSPMLLDKPAIWEAIRAEDPQTSGQVDRRAVSCDVCHYQLDHDHEGKQCPRCGKRVFRRKPGSVAMTAALVAAGYLLCFPAFYYPMSYTIEPRGIKERTILSGAERLIETGFWYLAVIVLIASFLVPVIKLIGLSWLVAGIYRPVRSDRGLVIRTKLHRGILHIGRWSNLDPMVVAMNGALMTFAGIASVHAAMAILPFALVANLTLLASRSFDPRLMWDAAGKNV